MSLVTGLEGGLLYTALGVFGGASVVGLGSARGKRSGRGLRAMLAVGTAVLTFLVVVRTVNAGRLPVVDRFELLVVCAWVLSLILWGVDRLLRQPMLEVAAGPTLALLVLFALLLVPADPLRGGAPGPAWGIYLHIGLAVLGCAALAFAAGVGALYLWQIRVLKRDPMAAVARRLPPLETLDRVNIVAVAFGFPFLALSAVGGALFVSGGPPWLLDPTVLVTFAGLAVYVVLFGARAFGRWHGRRIAWLTVVGFLVVIVGYFVASLCTAPNTLHAP